MGELNYWQRIRIRSIRLIEGRKIKGNEKVYEMHSIKSNNQYWETLLEKNMKILRLVYRRAFEYEC